MSRSVLLRGVSLALFAALAWTPAANAWGFYFKQIIASGGLNPGQIGLPMGIAVDANDYVYVVDRSDRVSKFTSTGQFVMEWDVGLIGPNAIAVDGGLLYVADSGDRILKYTTEGALVTQWGSTGTGDGQFRSPTGIAIGPDHSVYVADHHNRRVQKFTPEGVYLLQFGSFGTDPGEFDWPQGMVTDAAGNVYVTDYHVAWISVFTSQGEYLTRWGYPFAGRPTDIDVDSDGNFYVSDDFYQQIHKFSPTFDLIESFGSPGSLAGQFNAPTSLALDADGQIFVTDYQNVRVQKFAPCPSLAFSVQPQPQTLPLGATAVVTATSAGAQSYLWFNHNGVVFDGPRFSGSTTSTLTITDFQESDVGEYWVWVQNVCGQGEYSDHAALSLASEPTCFGPLAPPPAGMAAWWAMDAGPGNTVPDVLHPVGNKNHASLTGAAALVPGKVGTAVRCDGVNDGLHVPSTLSPRLAAASDGLSIDAWILPRSGSAPDAYRMILQKGLLRKQTTTVGNSTSLAPGYAFYVCNGGRLGFMMPDQAFEPATFEPAMPAMSMDEWHHVAVTIEPLVPGGGKFYVDGVEVATFTPPSGIIGNLADLYVGRFTPQLGPVTPDQPFNGDIDEVEVFVTAIDAAAVNRLWLAGCSGKRRVQVLASSSVSLRESTASTDVCFAIQNLSNSDHSYQWSIAASGPTAECPSSVPVVFTAASGNILVPAGQRVELTTTASVSPADLTAPFTRCYQLTVTDLADAGEITANGRLAWTGEHISAKAACTPPQIDVTSAPVGATSSAFAATSGGTGAALFTLYNDGPTGVTVPLTVRTRDPETGGASAVLRLEGQPAGTPWAGSLFVPAQGSAPVTVTVALDEYEPFLPDEIILGADSDGDLVFGDLASTHVAAGDDTSLALVDVSPASERPARGLTLRAAPNPFAAGTAFGFTLTRAAHAEVDVVDVTGRRVRRVSSARLDPGEQLVRWDGRDDAGAMLPAGVYLARVRAGNERAVVRLLHIR